MMAFGAPAILDPKFELRPIQDAVRAARRRIEILEAATTILQNAGNESQAVAVLQAQVAQLTTLINSLTLQVEDAVAFDGVSLSLTMESKMRHIARAAVRDLEPPNSANAVLMNRMFNRR